jgi:hypothetical protein
MKRVGAEINLGNLGWLERTVRFLIGLPMATAYFYARHLSMNWAYVWLGIGVAIMMTGLVGHDSHAVYTQEPGKAGLAPSLAKFAHAS